MRGETRGSKFQGFVEQRAGLALPATSGQRFVALSMVATVVATGLLFAAPLDQDLTNTISNFSFAVMLAAAAAAIGIAIVNTSGTQRRLWALMLAAHMLVAVLFAFDPQEPGGELTVALDFAVIPSLATIGSVIALCRPVLTRVTRVRGATDTIWVATALAVAFWPSVGAPIMDVPSRSELELMAHLAFIGTTFLTAVVVLAILPNLTGQGRYVIWFLGLGGAVTSAAGLLHIRFFHEGTLTFGSPADFLWFLGVGCLIIGALLAGENTLESTERGVGANAAMTLAPLVPALYTLTTTEHATNRLAVALVTAMALRVLALLFENHRLTQKLRNEAANDPLTGLANRRNLTKTITSAGELACRNRTRRAVMSIDLDRFKSVNDLHGHLVGDRVLTLIAQRLLSTVRTGTTPFRFGGDEFIVVTAVRHETDATVTAYRIHKAIEGTYAIDGLSIEIGATIGIAVDHGDHSTHDILTAADSALYRAKSAGRGQVVTETMERLGAKADH